MTVLMQVCDGLSNTIGALVESWNAPPEEEQELDDLLRECIKLASSAKEAWSLQVQRLHADKIADIDGEGKAFLELFEERAGNSLPGAKHCQRRAAFRRVVADLSGPDWSNPQDPG